MKFLNDIILNLSTTLASSTAVQGMFNDIADIVSRIFTMVGAFVSIIGIFLLIINWNDNNPESTRKGAMTLITGAVLFIVGSLVSGWLVDLFTF